jgi:hypothetical protein
MHLLSHDLYKNQHIISLLMYTIFSILLCRESYFAYAQSTEIGSSPKATESKATESKATESKATESKATESKATESKATESKNTGKVFPNPSLTSPLDIKSSLQGKAKSTSKTNTSRTIYSKTHDTLPTNKVFKKSSQKVPSYNLSSIEKYLSQHPQVQHIEAFELGIINWSMRSIHTLGVGTHHILSPTGGWTKQDLQKRAHQDALSKLERLAQDALYLKAHHRCPIEKLTRIYQSHNIQIFGDGSVHMPSLITFDTYRSCFTSYLHLLQKTVGSTQSGSTQSGSTQSGSTQSGSTQSGSTQSGSTQYLKKLTQDKAHAHEVYKKSKIKKRHILWVYLDHNQSHQTSLSKTMNPIIHIGDKSIKTALFKAIRWIKLSSDDHKNLAHMKSASDAHKPYLLLWSTLQVNQQYGYSELKSTAFVPFKKLMQSLRSDSSSKPVKILTPHIQMIPPIVVQKVLDYAANTELWIWSKY